MRDAILASPTFLPRHERRSQPLGGGVLCGKYNGGALPKGARFTDYIQNGGPRQKRMAARFVNERSLETTARLQVIAADLGVPALNPAEDRVMICGSPGLLKDLKRMLDERGFNEGNTTTPGDYVIERAFVEK